MPRVLVAEDDTEMRRLVVEALQKDGHTVLEAADGACLLASVTSELDEGSPAARIDVVVSDVRMPVHSGIDVLERMVRANRRVPFILMTAFGDDDLRQRAEQLGAVLIDKPLSLDALRAAVQSASGACA